MALKNAPEERNCRLGSRSAKATFGVTRLVSVVQSVAFCDEPFLERSIIGIDS